MKKYLRYILLFAAACMAFSCSKDDDNTRIDPNRRVFLFYADGNNNLNSSPGRQYFSDNIDSLLTRGYIPGGGGNQNVFLIFSKLSEPGRSYTATKGPSLTRIYKKGSKVLRDTLKIWPQNTISASAETVREVLTLVQQEFPAAGYGLFYTSHGTGWLPKGYYFNPSLYEGVSPFSLHGVPGELKERKPDPLRPMTKSIGSDCGVDGTSANAAEIEIEDFAAAIPMKLEYFITDCCLMGGVEFAYAMKDKADMIGFSPTECISTGYNMTTLTRHLIGGKEADVISVCNDFYEKYEAMSGSWKSATVTVVKTSEIQKMADAFKEMYLKYKKNLAEVDPEKVQSFFTEGRHYFYDALDCFRKAGATSEDIDNLEYTINQAAIYRAYTDWFLGEFRITDYCGFSMYLPADGTKLLNDHYRKLSWNKATGLVE